MKTKPIKATILESAYWQMDKDITNQTFYFVTYVNEKFNFNIFKESLGRLIKDMPMFSCVLTPGFWRDKWRPIENFRVEQLIREYKVDNGDFYENAYNKFLELKDKRLNLEKEPPLKVLIFYNEETNKRVIVFCTHHSLGDPRGTAQIIELTGNHYNSILKNTTYKAPEIYRSLPKIIFGFGVIKAFKTLIQTKNPNMKEFQPFMEMDFNNNPNGSGEKIERIVLEKPAINRLKANYKEHQFTINDILTLCTLKMTKKYNMRLDEPSKQACLSIGIDLRGHMRQDVATIGTYAGRDIFAVDLEDADNVPKFARELKEFRRTQGGIGNLMQFVTIGMLPIALQKKIWKSAVGSMLTEWGLRAVIITNIGRLDQYTRGFGDIVEDMSVVIASPYSGIPITSGSGYKDRMTLYFTKTNDDKGTTHQFKEDFYELLNEMLGTAEAK